MVNLPSKAAYLHLIHSIPEYSQSLCDPLRLMSVFGITDTRSSNWVEKLPFAGQDTTAGSETELQTSVVGTRDRVDLAKSIEHSSFYRNLTRRASAGEAPTKKITDLEAYLDTPDGVWENSWVRLPPNRLNNYAHNIFNEDMQADKGRPDSPVRCDIERFYCMDRGERMIRIPVSYLFKLALADIIGTKGIPKVIRETGQKMMDHFLNDNTSPETHSFHPVTQGKGNSVGERVAVETLLRYLLTQLLVQYANRKFHLERLGQKVIVNFAPNPPVRQRILNELISDAFYRDLYMSPCLSGWDCGEEKHKYMALCHEVLSRSQLNALAKLKEAGIIANNLVVLPNTSNISLANNGTHISIGSKLLTRLVSSSFSGFSELDEKYYGDLVLKISEHFLPLFVGTYSAAPYRLDFRDFHPERALGFLPHELDYTHLRMLWRRWKTKAQIKFLGHPLTPFGPEWLDRFVSKILRLKGDFVIDYRLLDYLMALLSTDESPALNGQLDNDRRLRSDLQGMGIFHDRMPLYMLCRLRQFQKMGFSGFEARHFSLFENIVEDMGAAVDLQVLITMLAYKYILEQKVSHQSIPDNPTVESERRQFFFGEAMGVPTFYVHKNSPNKFLYRIIKAVKHVRASRRYSGYIRISGIEYRRALIKVIRLDGKDIIDLLQMGAKIDNIESRINFPRENAAGYRLTQQILKQSPATNPFKLDAKEFNQAAENYYRHDLRKAHIKEAFHHFRKSVESLDSWRSWRNGRYNQVLLALLEGNSAGAYLAQSQRAMLMDELSDKECSKLVCLMLLVFHQSKP